MLDIRLVSSIRDSNDRSKPDVDHAHTLIIDINVVSRLDRFDVPHAPPL